MTRDQILAVTRPEDLFPGDKDGAQSIYRKMAKAWHPDLATGAADVFDHITQLYRRAIEKINGGTWEGPAFVQFETEDKRFFSYQARTSFPFAYGHTIISDDAVVYLFTQDNLDVWARTLQQITTSFTFANDNMRKECDRYLPHVVAHAHLKDGRHLLAVKKTPDLVRLRDVVTHAGTLDAKHVAWIVSSLLNLACYLSYTNLVHHDISPDTYFISPEHHSGVLIGGWWATAMRGQSIREVPRRTFEVMPFNAKLVKRASSKTDLELIRLTARECLKGPAPKPMQTWLATPGTGTAAEQYKQWHMVLDLSFGKRTFVPFPIDVNSVYRTQGKVV